jgi:hypothetical protein
MADTRMCVFMFLRCFVCCECEEERMEREQLALIGLARSNEVLRVCVELLEQLR